MVNIPKISFSEGLGLVAEAAPIMLLVAMLGSFSIIQTIRLASGLASALQYKRDRIFAALTIFGFSLAVSIWEWNEVASLAPMIGGEATLFLLKGLVAISLCLEFGLASTIQSAKEPETDPQVIVYSPSSNGANGSGKRSRASSRS